MLHCCREISILKMHVLRNIKQRAFFAPGVRWYSAVEEERFIVPEEILLEDLRHHEAVLYLAGPAQSLYCTVLFCTVLY